MRLTNTPILWITFTLQKLLPLLPLLNNIAKNKGFLSQKRGNKRGNRWGNG